MKDAAVEVFDGRRDEGIIPRGKYDPPAWSFANRVLVRFKKMDEDGLSSNYPTKRNKRYLLGLPIEEEDLREAVRVECGYCLNAIQTEMEAQWLVHRKGGRVLWRHVLKEDGTMVLPLVPRTSEEPEEAGTLVRPRTEPRKEADGTTTPMRILRVLPEEEEWRKERAAESSEAKHDTIGSA